MSLDELLTTIEVWRKEVAAAEDDNLLDSDRAETFAILDAAELAVRLKKLADDRREMGHGGSDLEMSIEGVEKEMKEKRQDDQST